MKTEKQTITELITACLAQEQQIAYYKNLLGKEISLKNGLYYYVLTKGLLDDYSLFSAALKNESNKQIMYCVWNGLHRSLKSKSRRKST